MFICKENEKYKREQSCIYMVWCTYMPTLPIWAGGSRFWGKLPHLTCIHVNLALHTFKCSLPIWGTKRLACMGVWYVVRHRHIHVYTISPLWPRASSTTYLYYQEYISTQECATLCSRLVSVADVKISQHGIFRHVLWAECTGGSPARLCVLPVVHF